MKCPKCDSEDLKVIDRRIRDGLIVRRRVCQDCLHRFNTVEILQIDWNNVVAVWKEKQELMHCAQIFSHIVQDIVDRIPDRNPVKKF